MRYESVDKCAKTIGVHRSSLYSALKKGHAAHGFHYYYAEKPRPSKEFFDHFQPKDDAFCTIKRKSKYIRRRDAVECWYECSKCGHTFAHGFSLNERRVLVELPAKCPRCSRKVLYWM